MKIWDNLCSITGEWCNAFNNLIDHWQVKAIASMLIVYVFGDIMALVYFVITVVAVDLIAKLNSIAYQARVDHGESQGGFLRGVYLAWHYDMFDADAMRTKFVPKCAQYLGLMIVAALAMRALKEVGAYDLLELPKSVFLYIVLTEVKSIAKNLKAADSPLYKLVASVLYMYYDRKGITVPQEVPPEELPNGQFYNQEADIPENRQREGNH